MKPYFYDMHDIEGLILYCKKSQWHVLEAVHRTVPIPVDDRPNVLFVLFIATLLGWSHKLSLSVPFKSVDDMSLFMLHIWGPFVSRSIAKQEVFVCMLKYEKKGMFCPLP